MELALGTVQFGLAYGAVGRGHQVDPTTAARILDAAWQAGVRCLDTAAAYGDIEARLADLCGAHPFRIISKIAPLGGLAPAERPAAVQASVARSLARLGDRLDALLFHSVADLEAEDGDALWAIARAALRETGRPLRLGVSCYAPEELQRLRARLDIEVAQLPGNALDQRLAAQPAFTEVELHVRSAFLQGLLLAPERGAVRVPAAATALQRWQQRCADAGQAPTEAALGIVQGLPGVAACVVGVETLAQFDEIAAAWRHARPLHWPELASPDADAWDPRRWP
ncbi:aldo/keto reductase [Roseateles asaccharophilus]|uniref:Aryl-alcohol dehydrogenase-like predicted oxidoreductase n=1 Tax=Roseateles asaccharophilus TaxID=582607 RepID=A0ABU2A9R0_9BURK|nr:aldo/keto reductase [Roseateles asaccharophilus]MDR7333932.1 aryl-alcohol dehydrogenase-like predicted oxidoreductase [Roseateles asaccharophilus]